MIPEINYWAVAIATVLSMGLGALWYSPALFLDRWATLARIDMTKRGAPVALAMLVMILWTIRLSWRFDRAAAWLLVPYDRPQLRGQIFACAQVLGEEYDDAGTRFRVRIDPIALKQLAREVQVITGQKE